MLSITNKEIYTCHPVMTHVSCLSHPFCEHGLSEIRAWINNKTHCFIGNVIIHPCSNINGGFTKLQLNVGHWLYPTTYVGVIIHPYPYRNTGLANRCKWFAKKKLGYELITFHSSNVNLGRCTEQYSWHWLMSTRPACRIQQPYNTPISRR